jgi:hypothetical protein
MADGFVFLGFLANAHPPSVASHAQQQKAKGSRVAALHMLPVERFGLGVDIRFGS